MAFRPNLFPGNSTAGDQAARYGEQSGRVLSDEDCAALLLSCQDNIPMDEARARRLAQPGQGEVTGADLARNLVIPAATPNLVGATVVPEAVVKPEIL